MKSNKMKSMKKRIVALLLCMAMIMNGGISTFAEETNQPVHEHTEECITRVKTDKLICTKPEVEEAAAHKHTDDVCYEITNVKELNCGLEETDGHSHGDGCYTPEKNLICEVPEHEHTGECYEVETKSELNCDKVVHKHSDACYVEENKLTCKLNVVEAHKHVEGCYKLTESKTLKCGLDEVEAHTHGDDCYEWTEELNCEFKDTKQIRTVNKPLCACGNEACACENCETGCKCGEVEETCACGNEACACENCETGCKCSEVEETCACGNEACACENCETGCKCGEVKATGEEITELTSELTYEEGKITDIIKVKGAGLSNKTLTVKAANTQEVLDVLKGASTEYAVESYVAYDFIFEDKVEGTDEGATASDEENKVKVTIEFSEAKPVEDVEMLKVIHLAESTTEKGETVITPEVVDEEKVEFKVTTDEENVTTLTGVEFLADSFSVYAIVWTAEGGATISGQVVGLDGKKIEGAENKTIEVLNSGEAVSFQSDDFKNLTVEKNEGTEEDPVITTTNYQLEKVQLVDESGNEVIIKRLKYDNVSESFYYSKVEADSGAETDWVHFDKTSMTLQFVYEKAEKTLADNHVGKNTSGYLFNNVNMTLQNDEVVVLEEGATTLFEENTKSSIMANEEKLGEEIKVDGVTYKYRRTVVLAKETAFDGTNGTSVTNIKLENDTIKYSTDGETTYSEFDASSNRLVFVYYKADVETLSITAKVANADKTGKLGVADVTFTVKKNAKDIATTNDAVVTFAEYQDEKNLINVNGTEYKFVGAYITDKTMYGLDADAGIQIDGLRIYYDKLQYRKASGSNWTDLNNKNLFLVYKETNVVSKALTMTVVFADGTNKNVETVIVNLEKTKKDDGTFEMESPVITIKSLIESGTIKGSYTVNENTDNKKVYTFQNALQVATPNSFTKTTYAGAATKAIVTGLKLTDTKIQYQYNNNTFEDLAQRSIVLVYAEELKTVDTIDSTALGVTMRMINFKNQQTNFGGGYRAEVGRTAGLLESKVNDDGYPSTTDGKVDFKNWFSENYNDGNILMSNPANHLFLKDYYDENRTFHFSSFENYAYYDQTTGNFTVYEEIGIPSSGTQAYYKRGNFMPYNRIEAGKFSANQNQYDSSGYALSKDADRYGENLYITQGSADYYHGLYLEAEFAQPNNGVYAEAPMRFEFNGDDDFWVYLDGVLVLDIGGIHDAQDGYIDFSTGKVHVRALSKGEATNTTIKAMFEAAEVDTTYGFKGDTFADGSLHKFQVFYMERGAGASNLELNFNLPTIPSGTIQVEKQLGNTDQEAYTDLPFAFRVMAQEANGKVVQTDEKGYPVTIETYAENKYVPLVNAYVGDESNTLTFDANGIFYLKPTEVASFPNIQANRKYYVEEVNLAELQRQNLIEVTKTRYTENGKNEQADMIQGETTSDEGVIDTMKTTSLAASDRKKVTFINHVTDAVLGNIQIEKKIANGNQNPDYGFAFKVTVQNNISGNLVPYVGDYYLKNANGQYLDKTGTPQVLEEGALPTAYGTVFPEDKGVISDIKVGQIAEIQGFYKGTQFFVEEVNIRAIYEQTPVIEYVKGTCAVEENDGTKTYHIKEGETAKVVVTNKEKIQYHWSILKQNKNDASDMLEGAEFTLVSSDKSVTYYGKSDETGTVQWYTNSAMTGDPITGKVEAGKYYLTETKAPTGFAINEEIWTIVFEDEASPIVYKGEILGDIPQDAEQIKNNLVDKVDKLGVRHITTKFYYVNEMLYELPATGGIGTYWYTIGGVVLMMSTSLIAYKKKREEVLGSR